MKSKRLLYTICGVVLLILFSIFLESCKSEQKPKLYDGIPVSTNEFPYQIALVSIGDKNKAICGGVVINSEWILTAAHCFDKVSSKYIQVYSGDVKLNNEGIYTSIKKIHKYDFINPKTGRNEKYISDFNAHDLCLIQLDKTLDFDASTEAIDYVNNSDLKKIDKNSEHGVILGWEKKELYSWKDELSKKEVRILDSTSCSKGKNMSKELESNMLCLGDSDQHTACKGDSGSGVFYLSSEGYKLLGIITLGSRTKDCNLNEETIEYDVMMNVIKYQEWITSIISKHSEFDTYSFLY